MSRFWGAGHYALKGKYIPAGDIEEIAREVIKNLFDYPLEDITGKAPAICFKSVNFNALVPVRQIKLMRLMIDKIISCSSKLICFINIDDLSYLKSFSSKNYLNIRCDKTDDEIHISNDKQHLIIEKKICINNCHLTNKFIGKGKKIIDIARNNNNLIKALSIGWRYGKMKEKGMSFPAIKKAEHIGDRNIYKYLSLNYLSPNIVNNIMAGRVPANINLQSLFAIASKYQDFKDQEKAFYKEQ